MGHTRKVQTPYYGHKILREYFHILLILMIK